MRSSPPFRSGVIPTGYLERIWALRANVTAYDAVYVALAQALDAPLLTRDRRLAQAVGRLGADRAGVGGVDSKLG